jgi:heat shock protein HslJ
MMPRRRVVLVLAGIFCVFGLAACQTPGANDERDATAGLPDLQRDLGAQEWLLDPDESSLANRGTPPVTLVFGEDSVSGAAHCNTYFGDLSVDDDDDTIAITNLGQTSRACAAASIRAEEEYLAALQGVHDVDLSDGYTQRDLVLSNDAGDRLAFTAINPHEQLTGTWYVVNVARDDAIQSVIDGTDPVIAFHDDGDVTLETGCNAARGSFELERDRLTVEDLAQTQEQCGTPAGVMEQEAGLVDALLAASQIQVVPGTLTFFDEHGAILIVATDRGPS